MSAAARTRPETTTSSSMTSAGVRITPPGSDLGGIGDLLEGGVDAECIGRGMGVGLEALAVGATGPEDLDVHGAVPFRG